MFSSPNLTILENLTKREFLGDTELIIQTLINEIKSFLNLDYFDKQNKIILSHIKNAEDLEKKGVFSIGVKRSIQNNILVIVIFKEYEKYLPFILLREIYNLFIPPPIREYELVQIVINQVIINNLSKVIYLNDWKKLIRENLEQYDLLSGGFNRLTAFDRLESFFRLQKSEYNATRFFFHYLRSHLSLISNKIENIERDIHTIFFEEFETYISKSMINDEIIETIRCLKEIFYKLEKYQDLQSYKKYFQKFKESGQLQTKLSQRKFVKNMDWIKNYSFIAPSYQLNRKTINLCIIISYFKFNPLLQKSKIFKILDTLPFFVIPKTSRSSFCVEVFGFFVLPKFYLKDLMNFIRKLESFGYLIRYKCFICNSLNSTLNLNYLKPYSQKQCIINPNHQYYEDRYELEFKMNFGTKFYDSKLNLLEFLLIDRIRFYSVSGLGFERKTETLQILKSDLLNEFITERTIINKLKNTLNLFHNSNELTSEFLQFIEINENFGFFYIKNRLEEILFALNFMDKILNNNPEIKSLYQFQNKLNSQYYNISIEKIITLNSTHVKNVVLNNLISNYFKSKNEYKKNLEKLKHFHNLFTTCYNLKIFNLEAIKKLVINRNLIGTIYNKKEEKLKESYEKWKLYKITQKEVDTTINRLLSNTPSIIKPFLINTITWKSYVKDYLHLILIDSPENQAFIEKIKVFFPFSDIYHIKDLVSNENLIHIDIHSPNITINEKEQLYSLLFNNLPGQILIGKSFLWSGHYPAISSRNFYDFLNKKFFYTKDLYEQYYLFIKELLGEPLKPLQERLTPQDKFWSKVKNISNLTNIANERILKEPHNFNIILLNKLLDLHLKLTKYILDIDKFKEIKQELFLTNYVKSIKFYPLFHRFGVSQYFLYLYPSDMNELDFRLLFTNTFQKIQYPACLDNSNSLFIKYIIPHEAPQLKYLHWLTKSKKVIREYCGFFIKKVYQILHFSQNLSSEGWVYDKDRFKMHMQSILFKPDYNFQIPEIKEYNITDKFISSYLGPESPEFESLSNIYNWKSIDIKSFLRTKKAKTVNHIINLLEKGLIFPYLSLKNLDLHDKVYIIIPNLKPELNNTLIKIFSFFNLAFIFEIEGEYFIYGFEQEVKFQNGLMIKLYFPKCEINEFIRLFDLLFEYLEIKDYLILNDLVDGKNLIRSIYGGLAFLDSYNPLKNLEWNDQDKIWQNPKIFTSKFEPIYPDLLSKDKQ